MAGSMVVMSDLHLGASPGAFDGFNEDQQAVLEGLLAAACSDGPLGTAAEVELVLNGARQIALLCLLDPAVVIETARLSIQMLARPREPLAGLDPAYECAPARLFEQVMLDLVNLQRDMRARKRDWSPQESESSQRARLLAIEEYAMLRASLGLPLAEAVAAVCTPATYTMGEDVARGLQAVLARDASLRYAIAGHTHIARIDSVNAGTQRYLNTGSWTTRLALPAPGEVNSALIKWLQQPEDTQHIPLRDMTQLVFALVNSLPDGSSSASLCAWEGGRGGSYRVLA
jgi:hypothetical protein